MGFFFPSPSRPDRLWGLPSLLSNGYRGYRGRMVKLTTHLHPVNTLVKEAGSWSWKLTTI